MVRHASQGSFKTSKHTFETRESETGVHSRDEYGGGCGDVDRHGSTNIPKVV